MFRLINLTLLALLFVAACAGGGPQDSISFDQPGGVELIPAGLPEMKDGDAASPMRATAAVLASLNGNQFESSGAGVSAIGSSAEYSSSPEQIAWAMYRFSGTPGEVISALSYSAGALQAGEDLYFGISDYSLGSWHFLPRQTLASGSMPLDPTPGHWQSTNGNTYVLLIAEGGDSFTLNTLQLNFPERHSISGFVLDGRLRELEGVLVTCMFGNLSAVTDQDGAYTLAGLPDGQWPIAATLNGHTFYDMPLFVTVNGADATAPDIVGGPQGSYYPVTDSDPANNSAAGAAWDTAVLLDSISAVDDPLDRLRFSISSPGEYYIYLQEPEGSAFFPYMSLRSAGPQGQLIADSAAVVAGSFAVGFTVASAPADFSLDIGCGAGGGQYSLSLVSGATVIAGGHMQDGLGTAIGGTLLEMIQLDSGDETAYLCGPGLSTLNYFDRYRVRGLTEIIPESHQFTFEPLSLSLDLQSERLDLDFLGTPLGEADSFEPNNSSDAPYVFPLVPFEGEDLLSVGGADPDDWYEFTPDPEQGLSIFVELVAGPDAAAHLGAVLYDSSLNQLASSIFTPDGLLLLPAFMTDGETYLLHVYNNSVQAEGYLLAIDSFDSAPLTVEARVDGNQAVPGAKILVADERFRQQFWLQTDISGNAGPLYLPLDEPWHFEFHRFGLSAHRATRRVVIGAEDTLTFNSADWGSDSAEPNNTPGVSGSLSLPLSLTAALSSLSDTAEFYRIDSPPSGMLALEFSSSPAGAEIALEALSPLAGLLFSGPVMDGETVYFEADGADWLELSIAPAVGEFSYSLQVHEAQAYYVGGTVSDATEAPLAGARLVLLERGDVTTSGADGSYHFAQPLAPGTYTVACLAVGFSPGLSQQSVELSSSDEDVNFGGLSYAGGDSLEPNDSLAEAQDIAPGIVYNASCGDPVSADQTDWYRLPALAAGSRLRISVQAEAIGELSGELYRGDQSFMQARMQRGQSGLYTLEFTAPVASDYYLRLSGNASYSLEAATQP